MLDLGLLNAVAKIYLIVYLIARCLRNQFVLWQVLDFFGTLLP